VMINITSRSKSNNHRSYSEPYLFVVET
jgi:hypothetical protein